MLVRHSSRAGYQVARGLATAPTSSFLVLGSGLVAGPLVDYLAAVPGHRVTVASAQAQEASELTSKHHNCDSTHLDVTDNVALAALIANHDVVVSFVPAPFHPGVARLCIKNKKHCVTASYTSPEMAALHQEALDAGITILNEVGVDPGIDHMSAMKIIDTVQGQGGKITRFISWCGGLPAPEDSNNALGYKFSWSPRGVLTAALNAAQWLEDGKVQKVDGDNLLKSAQDLDLFKGFNLEGTANRDSLGYQDLYNLNGVETMFRGTLRYKGYAEVVGAMRDLGLLAPEERADFAASGSKTWREVTSGLVGGAEDVEQAVAGALSVPVDGRVVQAMTSLGLFSSLPAPLSGSALDTLCAHLTEQLAYEEGERDMLIMHHRFDVNWGDRKEMLTSSLVKYGQPIGSGGPTAMAELVGLPAAMGAHSIANGTITRRGVLTPTTPDVYNPILEALELKGIRLKESAVAL